MFGFVKKVFFAGLTILSSFTSLNSLSCISINNQECKIRPQIVNVNSDEPVCFFLLALKQVNPVVVVTILMTRMQKFVFLMLKKILNIKVFNLMSRTNEKRHIEWHETCKCKCRLETSVCNNKKRWNDNKCRCECKKLIDKEMRDKGFIWNLSNFECNVINHEMLVSI